MSKKTSFERFICKVEKSPNCWEWKASKNKFGYGCFGRTKAHRASWMIFNGEIPNGMCVCHKCDNRSCVNPSHLFLGSYLDNNLDKMIKGRAKGGVRKGQFSSRKKLSLKDVCEIRRKYQLKNLTQTELASENNVTQSCISLILTNKTWN